MLELEATYLAHIQRTHAAYGYELDFRRLTNMMGVRVRIVDHEYSSATANPPAVINLCKEDVGVGDHGRFTRFHELAHILMQQCDVDAALTFYYGDSDQAEEHIERLCNIGARLLLMPAPMLREARVSYGNSAQAVEYLRRHGRVSRSTALRRLVLDDPHASCAGMVSSGRYVSDLVRLNFRTPFGLFDKLPEEFHLSDDQQSRRFRVEDVDVSSYRIPHTRTSISVLVAS
ncbi:ImmA/IrrE family metallo-endopeptidase [Deinococcus peraridilitoris]|uniref:Putative Zn peptidase n=1 Tax=Deinococcus peraridilitoris (strain DSM 19664 / LMG 22246 / CIP 109416 / KR-200) TaxID=937777 RepID=K9ZX17_DEIPD|nr:ImmA/IrrE family metallo-endopeptidase [Deinococcus peraridilitoris]AFZ66101.1 putative Zn peptidase [Deinococcus peraridilitoris DSM 19664]